MDARALTKLLIKIAGMFVLVYAIVQAPYYLSMVPALFNESAPWWTYLAGFLMPMIFFGGLAFALLLFPGTITNFLISNKDSSISSEFNINRIEEVTFSLLAVFLFFQALSDASYWLARTKLHQLIIGSQMYGSPAPLTPGDFAGIVATVLELLVAILLFFGARGLVRFKNKVRDRVAE